VGNPGNQYSVIQSIFSEINLKNRLLNQHIRWYSVILNLIQSYRDFRFQISIGHFSSDDGIPGRISTWLELENPAAPKHSLVIDSIESYIMAIARLGLLLSTLKKIDADYMVYQLKWIGTLLEKILADINKGFSDMSSEDIFVLAIKQATDNAFKLEEHLSVQKKILGRIFPKDLYDKNILQRIKKIPSRRIKGLFNLDDFWNGFIP
jgi:hypothetical protein